MSLAGCNPPSPTFVLNEKTGDLVVEARTAVEKSLVENFGAPNQLVAWEKFPIDYGKQGEVVALKAGTYVDAQPADEAGWKILLGRNLYMTHCVHCHGVSGDGNGPTARFLNPRPRDFRSGVLKFTSTNTGLKPSRGDIKRTLEQGIPGTYMPSFVLLGEDKLSAIIEYVRWLGTRGEYEIRLVNELAALGANKKDVDQQVADGKSSGATRDSVMEALRKSIKDELTTMVDTASGDLAEAWTAGDAPESVVSPQVKRAAADAMATVPVPMEARRQYKDKEQLTSIENGRELFLSDKTKCFDCHGPAGRGNGRGTEDYWPIPNTTPERKYPDPGLHDMWGHSQKPRNLASGQYRGGRRPVDIFRRIRAGIKGTQMPAFGTTVLKDEEIWDLVNYVLSVPFEGKPVSPAIEENHKVASSEK